jgi:hypothetical protein
LEVLQGWQLFLFFGLQHAILGANFLHDAFFGLEAMGASQVQNLLVVDPSKPSLDGG